MTAQSPSLTEIATRISRHLLRFAADPAITEKEWTDRKGEAHKLVLYWSPSAYRGGSRCMVRYVAYQLIASLTKAQAERYLAWLDAGNVGRHYDMED